MAKDYDIIKKYYGEKFAQFCRANFPTILELGDGVLAEHIMNLFAPNKSLYEDIIKQGIDIDFKEYVYSKINKDQNKQENFEITDTPEQLMRSVGYTLYKCETVEDVARFRPYWTREEELCTFLAMRERLSRCHIFFAVKDGAKKLDRKSFKYPRRQDEYGTSVISLQFSKNGFNDLSIKNRYNHTVANPDATFSNDLENICVGLTDSFNKYYGFNTASSQSQFEILGYTRASDGKMYKFNKEQNGVYYCPDNVVIIDGQVVQLDKFSQILVGEYVFDFKAKTVTKFDTYDYRNDEMDLMLREFWGDYVAPDAFLDTIGEIDKLEVTKGLQPGSRIIKINHDKIKEIFIEIDKNNDIISFKDNYTTQVGDDFLSRFKHIEHVGMESLLTCGASFMSDSTEMQNINLPRLNKCSNGFLFNAKNLSEIDLPNLETCGEGFLYNNKKLKTISLPKLVSCGRNFLAVNTIIGEIDLPRLQSCEDGFLRNNYALTRIVLPSLEKCGHDFIMFNVDCLQEVCLPRLESCGNYFLYGNNSIKELCLPSLKRCGKRFLSSNDVLETVFLPKLGAFREGFLISHKTYKNDPLRVRGKVDGDDDNDMD